MCVRDDGNQKMEGMAGVGRTPGIGRWMSGMRHRVSGGEGEEGEGGGGKKRRGCGKVKRSGERRTR